MDTDGIRIIMAGGLNEHTQRVVITDMHGNHIADWSIAPFYSVAIWGPYAVVVEHDRSVNIYDLETFEFVAQLTEIPSWTTPMIGSGNGRLMIGLRSVSFGVTVYEIGSDLQVSNTIGPLPLYEVDAIAPAPQGGLYVANRGETWSSVIFQVDSDGKVIGGLQAPSDTVWGAIDVDGCYNVIGVSELAREDDEGPFKGFKWVPDSRDPGCFVDALGHLFEHNITWLGREGVTRGCNPPLQDRFCSDDFVTRGQMAAFLHRALDGVLSPTASVEFIDDNGNTFEADIEWLGGTGVTKGCSPPHNDRYCPDDFVTRGQMAAFLVRALGYTDDGGGNLFIDDHGNAFEADIDKLGTAGVTKGCNPPINDRFCPGDLVTRGEMAAFIHRALGG